MSTLDQNTIAQLLSTNKYVEAFPFLASARMEFQRNVQSSSPNSGCCGSQKVAATSAESVRKMLRSVKMNVAGLNGESKRRFLAMMGVDKLRVSYNDGNAVVTVILRADT